MVSKSTSSYGLTRVVDREQLRYIVDSADLVGEHGPSKACRLLRINEQCHFGEYCTQRLVLQALGQLDTGELR